MCEIDECFKHKCSFHGSNDVGMGMPEPGAAAADLDSRHIFRVNSEDIEIN